MKKEILKAVMDRIRQEVPALRWVDADEGQVYRFRGNLLQESL